MGSPRTWWAATSRGARSPWMAGRTSFFSAWSMRDLAMPATPRSSNTAGCLPSAPLQPEQGNAVAGQREGDGEAPVGAGARDPPLDDASGVGPVHQLAVEPVAPPRRQAGDRDDDGVVVRRRERAVLPRGVVG